MSASPNTFMTLSDTKKLQQEQLRQNIVDAACLLMIEEGTEALTVRNVAHRLECSTKIVYSLFGSKEKLVNEMYLEGCRILAEAISVVIPGDSPEQYLTELGDAYWNFATTQPTYYRFMFGGALQDFKPDEKSLKETASSLSQVTSALKQFANDGKLDAPDPLMATQMLWSALHGVIHLKFSGHFADEQQARSIYDFTLNHLVYSLLHRG